MQYDSRRSTGVSDAPQGSDDMSRNKDHDLS